MAAIRMFGTKVKISEGGVRKASMTIRVVPRLLEECQYLKPSMDDRVGCIASQNSNGISQEI